MFGKCETGLRDGSRMFGKCETGLRDGFRMFGKCEIRKNSCRFLFGSAAEVLFLDARALVVGLLAARQRNHQFGEALIADKGAL